MKRPPENRLFGRRASACCFSTMSTSAPESCAVIAATAPASPNPTTITSTVLSNPASWYMELPQGFRAVSGALNRAGSGRDELGQPEHREPRRPADGNVAGGRPRLQLDDRKRQQFTPVNLGRALLEDPELGPGRRAWHDPQRVRAAHAQDLQAVGLHRADQGDVPADDVIVGKRLIAVHPPAASVPPSPQPPRPLLVPP